MKTPDEIPTTPVLVPCKSDIPPPPAHSSTILVEVPEDYSNVGRAELINVLENQARKIKELEATINEYRSGLHLPGWWCLHCDIFNGEVKEKRIICRSCDKPKPE